MITAHVCEQCGKTFDREQGQINRARRNGNRIFCGSVCMGLARKDSKNVNWKEGDLSMSAIHNWVKRRVPKPEACSDCGTVGAVDLANISNEYRRDISDWEWLCRSCHMQKDGRAKRLTENAAKANKGSIKDAAFRDKLRLRKWSPSQRERMASVVNNRQRDEAGKFLPKS